jgi:hypothetical protein
MVDSAKVNALVLGDIVRRVQNADAIRAGIAATDPRAGRGREEANLRQRRADLEAKRDRLILAVEDDLLTYAEVTRRLAPLRDEINLIDHSLSEMHQVAAQALDPEKVFSLAAEISRLPDYDPAAQRKIIALMVEKIVLFPKSLVIIYKIPVFATGKNEVRLPVH